MAAAPDDAAARYAKAEKFLPPHVKDLVDSPQVQPMWSRSGDRFWYKNRRGGQTTFVLVDAAAGTRELAFDNERLADGLKGVVDGDLDPNDLPISELELIDDGLRLVVRGQRVEVSLDGYKATAIGPAAPHESPSPDGRWALSLREGNLFLRDTTATRCASSRTTGQRPTPTAGSRSSRRPR